jgi:hypothetical protein
VTSEATIDVAVHTMAVDTAVTPTHIPTANSRGTGTLRGCPLAPHGALNEP